MNHLHYFVCLFVKLQIQFYDGYEPYLILRKKECPVYDQKFLGRMGNKNSQTLEVYAKG